VNGWDLVIIGAVVVGYVAISKRLAGTVVTSVMVMVVCGVLVGPDVLDLLDTGIGSSNLRLLAEIALTLVLFSDAALLDTRRLVRETTVPARLLGLALPLTIVLGTVVALPLFPDLGLFEAVVLAVLLAPTDAALGQAVVSDQRLPSALRQGLSVESGLNDGVCVPLLVTAVAFAELEALPSFNGDILIDLVEEAAIAIAVGVVVAVVVSRMLLSSHRRGWLQEEWANLVPPVAAVMSYAAAVELHGSGFIAAFMAGLLYGRLGGSLAHDSIELNEDVGRLLSSVTFLLFGAVMVSSAFDLIDVQTVVYAVLSLTVVRMLPVALSFARSDTLLPTRWFAGWFGPRGLATVVFLLTVVEDSNLPGTETIFVAATITVLLSVVAHGISAPGLTERYVGWLGDHDS
jgi:NhaP-type Na+/H+ or K+/H+ antiporter